jgi:hypothetical protein
VFSNVGEPDVTTPFAQRARQATVFGGRRLKRTVYEESGEIIQRRLKEMEIERVIDIGLPPSNDGLRRFDIPVDRKGILPAHQVSSNLMDSRVGVTHCPSDCMTKSGSVAAFLAHGVVPLVVGKTTIPMLEKGKHYLAAREASSTLSPEISKAGKEWYQENAHSRIAGNKYAKMIDSTA